MINRGYTENSQNRTSEANDCIPHDILISHLGHEQTQRTTNNPYDGPVVAPVKCDLAPDLQKLVAAWPTLPEAVKAGIVATVDALTGQKGGVPRQ